MWFGRGMYVGALVAAGERLVEAVDPTDAERASLVVEFQKAYSNPPAPEEAMDAWVAWREARVEAAARELREVIERARRECFGVSA